ncbi:MAG TPA: CHASE2 domain-containing protein, partial [Trichocoleus sp.]
MIYSFGPLLGKFLGLAQLHGCSRFQVVSAALRSNGGRLVLVSSLLINGLITGSKQVGLLEPAELFWFDHAVQRLPDARPDPRMVIVGITEEDIQQYGWPLSDDVLAQLLANLQQHQPRVVGLDLYRSSFRAQKQTDLQRQLQARNLVAIMNVGSDPEVGEVPPPPTVPPSRVGFNDLPVDPDGTIRRNLLFVRTAQRDYYSFGLRVVLAYLTPSTDASSHRISSVSARDTSAVAPTVFRADNHSLYLDTVALPALGRSDGGYQQADDRGYQILLKYRNRTAPARQLSISQVLSGRFDASLVRDRIVLVGTTAPSLKDQFYTPYSAQQPQEFTMPGVVIHAHMISQLLDAAAGQPALYRVLPPRSEFLWLWGWCLVGGCLVWRFKQPGGLLMTTGLAVLGLGAVGTVALIQLVWVPIAEPTVGLLATAATVMAYKLLYRSTHDSLTHLLNREAFMLHLGQVLKQHWRQEGQPPVIVVFLDINRFKVINESLGHEAGDQVLITLAQRLKQHTAQGSAVARVGGDEFALLLQDMNWNQAGQFLDQLQHHLTEPLMVREQKFSSTVSMGIAVTQAGYNHQAADLLRDAHTAMYRAKALGRSRYEVFAAGMLVEAVTRLKLESDLITAL